MHVLSLPPAFVLSQDQTLMFKSSFPKSQVHSTRSFLIAALADDNKKILFEKRVFRFLALLGLDNPKVVRTE